MILFGIGKILKNNCIEVAYINSLKVIDLATITRKISESELITCILSFKNQNHIKIKQIVNINERKKAAIDKINALFTMRKYRRVFQRFVKMKKV